MFEKLAANFFRSQFERVMLYASKHACVIENSKNPIQEGDITYVLSINQFLGRLEDIGTPQEAIDRARATLIERNEVAVVTTDRFFQTD